MEVIKAHKGTVYSVCDLGFGKFASASFDRTIHIWITGCNHTLTQIAQITLRSVHTYPAGPCINHQHKTLNHKTLKTYKS